VPAAKQLVEVRQATDSKVIVASVVVASMKTPGGFTKCGSVIGTLTQAVPFQRRMIG
jgi:hypothetical protein